MTMVKKITQLDKKYYRQSLNTDNKIIKFKYKIQASPTIKYTLEYGLKQIVKLKRVEIK